MYLNAGYRQAARWQSIIFLASILFSWNFVVCAARPSLLHKEHVQCTASIEPKNIIVNENTKFQTIWCNAAIDNSGNNNEIFTQPAIDMSFGLSPTSGMFYLRGQSDCSQQNGKCFSQFNISTQALRQLIGSSPDVDDNSVTHHQREPRITFSCNVADTARNRSAAIRCSDTGSIHFTSVLKHGDPCSKANLLEQCGQNMRCGQSKTIAGDYEERCVCKETYWNYAVSRTEVICVEKADLGEKCNFTKQCTENNQDSLCEFDSTLGFKICKCLSGFEEVHDVEQPDKLLCSPIKPEPVRQVDTVATDQYGNSKVYNHKDLSAERRLAMQTTVARSLERESTLDFRKNSFGGQQQPEQSFANSSRLSQIKLGLSAFGAVLLIAMLIVVIIFIRNRRYRMMTIDSQKKNKSFEKGDLAKGKNVPLSNGKQQQKQQQLQGPLLSAIHKLSDDEEVDVRIDEDVGIIEDNNQNSLPFYNDQCDQNSQKSNSRSNNMDVVMAPNPTIQSSQHSLNSLSNFSYSAKQSTV